MVFALPTMQQLYSLEVSLVSSLVQSGIWTVGFYDFLLFLEVVLIYVNIKEGAGLFLLG